MRECEQSRSLAPAVFSIAALGWIMLFALDRMLPSGQMSCHGTVAFDFFGAQREAGTLAGGLRFLGGWVIMTIAMMLPTDLPFARILRRKSRGGASQGNMFACLASGSVSVWILFGLLVLGGGILFGRQIGPMLEFWAGRPVYAAGLFAFAGIFQFLPIKQRCLEKCRSQMRLAGGYWEAPSRMWECFRLGIRHGAVCVGSCGALMLLMFAVESAHLLWMFVLAIVMAIEKNSSWGPKLARPLGLLLLTGGVLIFLFTGRPTA